MDVDADRRLAFPEFRQGLSLLGMTSAAKQAKRYVLESWTDCH